MHLRTRKKNEQVKWQERNGLMSETWQRETQRMTHFIVHLRLHFKLFLCCISFDNIVLQHQHTVLWSAVKCCFSFIRGRTESRPVVWLGLERISMAVRWIVWVKGFCFLVLSLAAWLSTTMVCQYFHLTNLWSLETNGYGNQLESSMPAVLTLTLFPLTNTA